MKLFDFQREFSDDSTIVAKLRTHGLLADRFLCPICMSPMLDLTVDKTDGLIFACNKRSCRQRKSIRVNSFFEQSKMSLYNCLLFIHLFSKNYPQKLIIDDFPFSNKTAVDWSKFCRELCVCHFESNMAVIGGEGSTVEIDETMAVKRKYDRGRVLRAGWLFGGIERRTDGQFKCFIRMVYDRSEAHLTHLLRQHVAPGTHIITDGWAAYRNLRSMNYTHDVVIHEENFVSPDDREVHTQTIEATWSSLKRFIRSHGTNKGPHYLEYICEYIFRREFPDAFVALLDLIRRKHTFTLE